jgi:hypothetical protein
VVSLDGVEGAHPSNNGRLRYMSESWKASCPDDPIDFVVCPGTVHSKRGLGVSQAFEQCTKRALDDGANGTCVMLCSATTSLSSHASIAAP